MKLIVNELPYYGDECLFSSTCSASLEDCPRYWNKYKICSIDNSGECEHLIEYEKFVQHLNKE